MSKFKEYLEAASNYQIRQNEFRIAAKEAAEKIKDNKSGIEKFFNKFKEVANDKNEVRGVPTNSKWKEVEDILKSLLGKELFEKLNFMSEVGSGSKRLIVTMAKNLGMKEAEELSMTTVDTEVDKSIPRYKPKSKDDELKEWARSFRSPHSPWD